MYDYLIVGSGLFGAVFAHEAKQAGKSVLVLERRDHIGGKVVSRFFRKFISSASKYRHQMYGFSSSAGCSISILNRCSMSI